MLDVIFVGILPPHRGGSAILLSLLLPSLADRGMRIRVLAPWPSSHRDEDVFSLSNRNFDVIRYEIPFLSCSLDSLPGQAYYEHEGREIRRSLPLLLEERPADLIVLGRESYLRHVPQIAREGGIPAVLIAQGGRTFEGMVNRSGEQEYQRLIERARSLEGVLTVGRHLAEKLEEIGIPRPRIIENPVDTNIFKPQPDTGRLRSKLGLGPLDPVVLHISKLAGIKRPFDIVSSAHLALAEEPNLHYIIVGEGPLRESMQREIFRRGIGKNFIFTGWIAHNEVAEYLNLADCFLLPSESEGQALSCLEAQACGCVVVASDVDGNRELIDHNMTGLLVPCGDSSLLAEATLRVVLNPQLRAEISIRARRFALSHGLDIASARYELALRSFANAGRRRLKC